MKGREAEREVEMEVQDEGVLDEEGQAETVVKRSVDEGEVV